MPSPFGEPAMDISRDGSGAKKDFERGELKRKSTLLFRSACLTSLAAETRL